MSSKIVTVAEARVTNRAVGSRVHYRPNPTEGQPFEDQDTALILEDGYEGMEYEKRHSF